MKKIYLILVVFPFLSFSQNYQTIQPDVDVYFKPSSAIKITLNLFASESIALRSLHMLPVDTSINGNFYSNFNEIHDEEYSTLHWFESCLSPDMQSWIGGNVLIRDDGVNVFLNRDHDSVYIDTQAELNESFVFYTYPDNSYFLATVSAHEALSFLGISDPVKTFTLQLYNAYNEPVNSPVNGMQLMVSENFGFYKTINFRDFPGFANETFALMEHTLYGHENIDVGYHKMTMRDVFDFEVGDLYHYETDYNSDDKLYWYIKSIKEILNKEWITVSQVKYTIRNEVWGYEGPIPFYELFHTIDTIQENYSDIDTVISNYLPFEPYPSYIPWPWEILTYNIIQTDQYGGLPVLVTSNDGYDQFTDTCYHRWWFDSGSFGATKYVNGGGILHHHETIEPGNYSFSYNSYIIYYKKGEEEWGIPLEPPIIGVEDHYGPNQLIEIFPNPADQSIRFRFPTVLENQNLRVKVSDCKGSLLMNAEINVSNNCVDVTRLANGLYFVSFSGDGFIENKKLLIRHK